MSKELPILFNTEMVKAILEGRKTCTRRLVKPQPQSGLCYTFGGSNCGTWGYPSKTAHEIWGDKYRLPKDITNEELKRRWNSPYHADDILYVRETWHKYQKRVGEGLNCHIAEFYGYKASIANSEDAHTPWKPSIHMPKEAARIWLKVKNVKTERLHSMTDDDAVKEGIYQANYKNCNAPFGCDGCGDEGYNEIDGFAELWDSTIKKSDLDRYSWDADPWVWCKCQHRNAIKFRNENVVFYRPGFCSSASIRS